jgi:hypothetical protein
LTFSNCHPPAPAAFPPNSSNPLVTWKKSGSCYEQWPEKSLLCKL